MIGRSRACGTPGCCLPDWHKGPHTLEQVACRSDPKREIAVRRSPRFVSVPFPWHALDLDLQAMVFLQLSGDTHELLTHLARLAYVIRPLRVAILRAMQLDDRIEDLMSASFTASDLRLGVEPSPFCGAYHAGELSSPVDEQMHAELRLLRPRTTPRSWKWMLQLHVWTSSVGCDTLMLASAQAFYTPSQRIGQLRHRRSRGHTFCKQRGVVYAERRETILQRDVLIYPKLTTVSKGIICLSSCGRPIITWMLSREAVCVLELVRAFVH